MFTALLRFVSALRSRIQARRVRRAQLQAMHDGLLFVNRTLEVILKCNSLERLLQIRDEMENNEDEWVRSQIIPTLIEKLNEMDPFDNHQL